MGGGGGKSGLQRKGKSQTAKRDTSEVEVARKPAKE